MAGLSDECKAIISENPIGQRLTVFYGDYSEFVSKSSPSPSCEEIARLAITGSATGAHRLIKRLLLALQGLNAACELPSHRGSSRKSLEDDICDLYIQFPEQISVKTIAILLEYVTTEPINEESLWSAVYDLFSPRTPPPRSKSISPSSLSAPFLHDLHSDWNGKFFKDSLMGLQQQMKDCISGSLPQYYAKTLVFVQSSGMGKSRLADTFGTTCPMINFILREESVGYPPTDGQIQAFMRMPMSSDLLTKILKSPSRMDSSEAAKLARAAIVWNHSVMFGILEASFEIFNKWVEGKKYTKMSLEELARIRHEEMKPLDTDKTVDTRSRERIDFCEEVVKEASKIATRLAGDKEWRKLFNNEEASAVRRAMEHSEHIKGLLNVVERLIGNLKEYRRVNQSDDHLLVIVFDEAASLFSPIGSSKLDSGRYIALNRMCSLLKDYPLWFFFLSTESKVEKILPADHPIPADEDEVLNYSNKSSARFAYPDDDKKLRVFPAFVAFPLDIEDRSRMRDPALRKIELAKPMVEFSRPKHMAMFGRRLWYAYSDPQRMYSVARLKLVGGGAKTKYNPRNQNHVFAALSFRLSLDPCLENSLSLPLVRTAVGAFMRVVISIHQPTGNLHTVTPSEPILAKAAMEHLCEGNWHYSIRTLTRVLLQQGLIEKGLKGELFARLVLILAHDSIRLSAAIPENLDRIDLERMPTFTVEKFLMALYAEDHHQSISEIDTRILQAKMNFTHFTSTRANLPTGGTIMNLCHDLLRRSAAMQLSPNNPTFDQLIPIYFGSDKEPFNPSECGAILIQDKNQMNATTPNHIFHEQFAQPPTRQSPRKLDKKPPIYQSTEYTFDDLPPTHQTTTESSKKLPIRQSTKYAFKEMSHPILFLLFDMNINPGTAARVQVSCSTDDSLPSVWAIHSRGHTDRVFGCLKAMGVRDTTEVFFASASVGEKGMHSDIARRNLLFDELERGFRYARIKADGSGYEEESDNDGWQGVDNDRDIQMEDA